MKSLGLTALFLVSLTACVSAPRYTPQTMFPHGSVQINPVINQDFSDPLHKFVELEFFNDNKEWVEIENFTLETSGESPSEILTEQNSLDRWVSLKADETVHEAGVNTSSASLGFALLGIGLAIAEIASNSHNSHASAAAFVTSDVLAVSAAVEEDNVVRTVNRTLNIAPLSKNIVLPPGQPVTRWFVINTPDGHLPASFYINYSAKGRISGSTQIKNIELINQGATFMTREDQQVSQTN